MRLWSSNKSCFYLIIILVLNFSVMFLYNGTHFQSWNESLRELRKNILATKRLEERMEKFERQVQSTSAFDHSASMNYDRLAFENLFHFSFVKASKELLNHTLGTLNQATLQQIAFTKITDHIPNEIQIRYTKKWKGLTLPLLMASPMGRLGNVMGEYATLISLQLQYKVSTVLLPQMEKILAEGFHDLSIQTAPKAANLSSCKKLDLENKDDIYNYKNYHLAASGLLGANCFIFKGYPFEFKLFSRCRKEITKEFTFSNELRNKATTFLLLITEGLRKSGELKEKKFVYVGVHVRRTDYERHMKVFGGKLPSINYVFKAMDYYTKKYENVIFIGSSDDKEFLRRKLSSQPNFFVSPGKTRLEDMSLLASCNHSIMTLGSYGFWSSFLAGGEVVYPEIQTKKVYRFTTEFYQRANLTFFTPIKIS